MFRKTTLSFILIFTATVLLISACTPASTPAPPTDTPTPTEEPTPIPLTLTDGLGKTITLAGPAQRVISLAPSNTEVLFYVGAGAQVVGRDSVSDFPAEALSVTNIGGGFGALDTETILALDPDLILAADLTASEQIQTLEDLGLTVFTVGNPLDLNGVYENLRIVAQLTGHTAEVEPMIAALTARVATVEEKIAGIETRPLVFYEIDGTDPNAVWTPGPGTFIDTLITMAGGQNLGNILEGPWVQISLEALIVQNPEIILLGDAKWGGVTPEAVAARAGWDALTAVTDGRVYPFDDDLVSRPGARLVDGLETLAKFLHPEVFE